MSSVALTPKDLELMPDKKRQAVEFLLRKFYIPDVGYVELNWSPVANALGHDFDTQHRKALLAWLRKTFTAWTITMSEDGNYIRFDGRK